jgi:hypothetical protein
MKIGGINKRQLHRHRDSISCFRILRPSPFYPNDFDRIFSLLPPGDDLMVHAMKLDEVYTNWRIKER